MLRHDICSGLAVRIYDKSYITIRQLWIIENSSKTPHRFGTVAANRSFLSTSVSVCQSGELYQISVDVLLSLVRLALVNDEAGMAWRREALSSNTLRCKKTSMRKWMKSSVKHSCVPEAQLVKPKSLAFLASGAPASQHHISLCLLQTDLISIELLGFSLGAVSAPTPSSAWYLIIEHSPVCFHATIEEFYPLHGQEGQNGIPQGLAPTLSFADSPSAKRRRCSQLREFAFLPCLLLSIISVCSLAILSAVATFVGNLGPHGSILGGM
ncbi:uncharacterized protein BDR25DRAFT_348593 [Lindgomyces ingoldianus]|uniref:Uncharacterized protein n=1 Tax=Lindgomyces ingoldianus TaxID=673940 RepID=A0ACB6RJ38_9PLEO|nr:uncharacterized protein BDR25DRAFT_348593 [Lindgomyces ingoldianus]KAF2478342.1 hypothetical protein BDR25DRAFT_348593 [Lindgomyces ingoldianus]